MKMKNSAAFVLIQLLLILPIISILSAGLYFIVLWNDFSTKSLEICLIDIIERSNDEKYLSDTDGFINGLKKLKVGAVLFTAELSRSAKRSNRLYLSAKSKFKNRFFHLEEIWNCSIQNETKQDETLFYVEAVKSWSRLSSPLP